MKQLLTAVVMVLAGAAASAQVVSPKYDYKGYVEEMNDFEVNNIYYKKTSDNTVEVSRQYDYGASYHGDVVIPREVQYDGVTYTVTRIGKQAFFYSEGLRSVKVPSTVTSIGFAAFYRAGLSVLELPWGLETIENGAFEGCNLKSFVVPNSVKTIGDYVFQSSYSLKHVTIGVSVESIGILPFNNYEKYVPLITLTSLNPTPPPCLGFGYTDTQNEVSVGVNFDKCVLYVPIGCKEKYAAADGWKDFKNIVEKDLSAESGITTVASEVNNDIHIVNGVLTVAADNTPVHVMTIDGRSVLNQLMHEGQPIELPANIYIVTTPSGSRKFLLR